MSQACQSFSICFVALHAAPLFSPVTNSVMIGGAEIQQYYLGRAMAWRGSPVSFILKDDPAVCHESVEGIKLYKAFRPRHGLRLVRGVYPQLIKLWKALKMADAEVYYVRGAKYESGIVWLFCKLKKRLMVQAIAHDYDCAPDTLHNLKGKLKKRLYLRAVRDASLVLAQTRTQQRLLWQRIQVASEVVPNIISIPETLSRLSANIRNLLWVGTIKPIKQPYQYLELAKRFPERQFTMIGPVSDKYADYRERFKAAANQVPNLTFIDYVPLQRIDYYFAHCDALVSTSQKEGFPNVFLQAWSHGKPVLSLLDPDGVIRRHCLGMTAPDIESLAQLLQRESLAWGLDKAENARCYMRQKHSTEQVVSRLEECIKQRLK